MTAPNASDPSFEHDRQVIQRFVPVLDRSGPSRGHFLDRQVQHLPHRFRIRERPRFRVSLRSEELIDSTAFIV
jgi:hypothetical protein